jgi:isoleucyl-tRNA synthetase
MTVVIDTNLTPELIEKGFVREVISKLQTMRKEAGFDVVDRITVTYKASEALAPVIAKNADAIASAVLATAITEGDAPEGAYAKEWSINGECVTISVEKV